MRIFWPFKLPSVFRKFMHVAGIYKNRLADGVIKRLLLYMYEGTIAIFTETGCNITIDDKPAYLHVTQQTLFDHTVTDFLSCSQSVEFFFEIFDSFYICFDNVLCVAVLSTVSILCIVLDL